MLLTGVILFVAVGLGLMLIFTLFAGPLATLGRIIMSSAVGALALWLLNLALGWAGFHFPLNPLTVVVVGMLGLPGLLALILIRAVLV